jgi:hypothetical protein
MRSASSRLTGCPHAVDRSIICAAISSALPSEVQAAGRIQQASRQGFVYYAASSFDIFSPRASAAFIRP